MRLNAHAFIRKSRISGNHFDQRRFARAECGRQRRSHRIRDAETPNHLCAGLHADLFEQVNRRDIIMILPARFSSARCRDWSNRHNCAAASRRV